LVAIGLLRRALPGVIAFARLAIEIVEYMTGLDLNSDRIARR